MVTTQLDVIAPLMDVALRRRPATIAAFKTTVLEEFTVEAATIKQEFPALLHANLDRKTLDIIIQGHQKELLDWMQAVIAMLPKKEQGKLNVINPVFGWVDCYKTLYSHLHDLLLFLQRHFAPYMHPDYLIPVFNDGGMKGDLQLIERRLKKEGVDPNYWAMLRQALDDLFVSNCTYEHNQYLKKLYKELLKLCSGTSNDFQEELSNLLIRLNFNDSDYKVFAIGLMKETVEPIFLCSQKILRWQLFRKDIRQVPLVNGISYDLSGSSLITYLIDSINAEIEFIEAEIKSVDMKRFPADLLKLQDTKFTVFASSYHINFALDMLAEIGWMEKPNKTHLGNVLAYFVSTENKDKLEGKQLRKRLYGHSQSTKIAVIEMMVKLIAFIRGKELMIILVANLIFHFSGIHASVICGTLIYFLIRFVPRKIIIR